MAEQLDERMISINREEDLLLEHHDLGNDREDIKDKDDVDESNRIDRGGSYERDLRRESRRYAPYSKEDRDRNRSGRGERGKECRIYVTNLPYSAKWQAVKDFFKKVGDVSYVDLFEDDKGRFKGCCTVEFFNSEDAQKAIKELDNTDFDGRTIFVREDRMGDEQRSSRMKSRTKVSSSSQNFSSSSPLAFLQGINYNSDPLSCTVFVSNIDYKVTWFKLKDVFKRAGNVIRAEIMEDSDHKSKGMATVLFETAADAINAVSMFNGQILNDRVMHVKLDRGASINNNPLAVGAANMGRTSSQSANPMVALQLLQSLQSLAALTQLGGLGNLGNLSNLASGGMMSSQAAAPSTSSMVGTDAASSNPFAALGILGNALGMSGAAGATSPTAGATLGSMGTTMGTYGTTLNTGITSSSGGPSKQVFVRNLPWKCGWQELKDKFRTAGNVVRADIMTEPGGRSKGCGIVVFDTPEEADRAILLLNGTTMDGREIDVRLDRFA